MTAKDRRIATLELEVSRLTALLAQARANPYPVPLAAPEWMPQVWWNRLAPDAAAAPGMTYGGVTGGSIGSVAR